MQDSGSAECAPLLPGFFIAFEGGEGAGKSTQLRRLEDALRQAGYNNLVVTHEPGATASGGQLRALLLDPATELGPRAEALLYAADRAEHVAEVLLPALQNGALVLCDRYVDSSLAYQGAGRKINQRELERVQQLATGGLDPDLTILLDVDPSAGLGPGEGTVGRRGPDRTGDVGVPPARAGRVRRADAAPSGPVPRPRRGAAG